jgi:gas vesicle protein
LKSHLEEDVTMSNRIYYNREAEMQAMREKTVMAVVLTAVGLAIGAVFALLFAPAAGHKTREDIAHTFEEGLKDGRSTVEPVIERLQDEISDLRSRLEDRIKA